MAKYIGRLIDVGFGIENPVARGTKVNPEYWQAKTDITFEETFEQVQDESSIGVIADSRGSEVVKKWAEGDIGGNVGINGIGYPLLATFGSVASMDNTDGTYSHGFTVANNNTHPSLTLAVKDPNIGEKVYPLASVDSLTITADEGAYATFSASFKSKPSETPASAFSVTYAPETTFLSRNCEFKVANNVAGLATAQAVCIQNFEITFSKNLIEQYCLSSQTPTDFLNQQFAVEGSFTAVFDSTTFRDFALAGTDQAVRFKFVSDNPNVGATDYEMTITLPLASFTEFSRSMGNDEIVTQTLTFKGMYSVVDGGIANVNLVNTKADYSA